MSLSELCIRRPVMTWLLSIAALVAGIVAYTRLPVAAIPARIADYAARTAARRTGSSSSSRQASSSSREIGRRAVVTAPRVAPSSWTM